MRKITGFVIAIGLAVILGWDVYVAINGDWNSTVSAVVYDFTSHRMVSFALGCIVGHLIWPLARNS